MVQHLHWRGDNYKAGIEGQRLAIVGYSHWGDDDDYGDEGTRNCITKVISGEWAGAPMRFFATLRNYFGFESHAEFWHRIVFFNFLPDCVGDGDARFKWGTEEQTNRGRQRLISVLEEEKPHKVLIFTTKGWQSRPPTLEEIGAPEKGLSTLASEFPKFSRGTYGIGGHTVMAFGLRHPQGASGDLMRRAVRHILNVPLLK
jgi:hypothetical protein